MVLLTTTQEILQAISLLSPTDLDSLDLESTSLPKSTSDPISHNSIIGISHILRSKPLLSTSPSDPKPSTYTLSTLLRHTRPYFPPPPPPPPKTREFLALQASLLAASEARTYNSLLSPDLQSGHLPTSPEDPSEQTEDDISPSLVLNIFLSIVLCGFAVWHVTRFWSNDGLRVLCSLGAGIGVGVAEVVVYSSYLRKVGEARRRERRKREVKRLGREISGSENDRNPETPTQKEGADGREAKEEKEEVTLISSIEGNEELIWGKGTHGGFRRRVREKWEKERELK